MIVFTIGHSTRTLEAFTAALAAAHVEALADVRRFPHSRRHPHFNAAALAAALPAAGIAYHHFGDLGGRRGGRAEAPSPHTLWRVAAFRGYADYAETAPFRAALSELRALAAARRTAIMCAEAMWWRCHRRIIADYLLAAGDDVRHILDVGKIEPARLTDGAAPRGDGTILYAAEQGLLL